MEKEDQARLVEALWKIYNRPSRPLSWFEGGNLPWNESAFSERMLREHLDESHGAASRITAERAMQLGWLREKLAVQPGMRLLDITCGPGLYAVELAKGGNLVTGIDFSPASIAYARQLANEARVAHDCTFVEADIRQMDFAGQGFDGALFLYGQLAVFPRHEAQMLLEKVYQSLRPGGRLCLELLNQDRVDKVNSTWWFTDDTGLWGDRPFLHLGERFWLAEEETSVERFQIIDLETGQLETITLSDQTYSVEAMSKMLKTAGFSHIDVYPAWDNVPLYDRDEWIIYVAQMPESLPSQ